MVMEVGNCPVLLNLDLMSDFTKCQIQAYKNIWTELNMISMILLDDI